MTTPSLQHSADVHMLASAGFRSGLCWRLPTRPAALNISWSVWEQRWVSLHRLRRKSADDEKTQQSSVSAARRHDARRREENKKQPCDCEGSAAGRKQVELNQTAKTLLLSLFRDTQVQDLSDYSSGHENSITMLLYRIKASFLFAASMKLIWFLLFFYVCTCGKM